MGSNVQSGLELMIKARIKKVLDSGSKENASLNIVEDKPGNLLRFSACMLHPRAIDDQGHASSEQQQKILQ